MGQRINRTRDFFRNFRFLEIFMSDGTQGPAVEKRHFSKPRRARHSINGRHPSRSRTGVPVYRWSRIDELIVPDLPPFVALTICEAWPSCSAELRGIQSPRA